MQRPFPTVLNTWPGRWTFILAATGSAVGLGNIWKFPTLAGNNGGGAFLLVYGLCLLLMGVPLLMAEVLVGRRGRGNPVAATGKLVQEARAGKGWVWTGRFGVIAGFMILSVYSVVGGLGLAYVFFSAFGDFKNADAAGVTAGLESLLANPRAMVGWHTLFLMMVLIVSTRGITRGLQRALNLIMPMLFLLLIAMLVYAYRVGDMPAALHFLFDFNPQELQWSGMLDALAHAFFTLSLGMGAMMAYGAYMPAKTSIGSSLLMVALLDTLVALAAGLIVFALLFAQGGHPGSGFGLMFRALPQALGQLPAGQFFSTMFFVLVSLAAWSSAISVLEPAVAWMNERLRCPRPWSVVVVGMGAWALGLGTIFSFNLASGWTFWGGNFFSWLNFLTASLLLPLDGLLITLLVGWVMSREAVRKELAMRWNALFLIWYGLLKYIVPIAVVAVFAISVKGFSLSLCGAAPDLPWCPAAGPAATPVRAPAPASTANPANAPMAASRATAAPAKPNGASPRAPEAVSSAAAGRGSAAGTAAPPTASKATDH